MHQLHFILLKSAIILYVVIFGCYIIFARQPDYFDGQLTTATIHFTKDEKTNAVVPKAIFKANHKEYAVNAAYPFRSLHEGDTIKLIYETSQPEKAAVYGWWGYWIKWGEALFSVCGMTAMYFIAISITSNPTPEALIEQLEDVPRKKRKYKN